MAPRFRFRSAQLPVPVTDEIEDIRRLVLDYVEREIRPVEQGCLHDGLPGIPSGPLSDLQAKAKDLGLWCFGTPEEHGGAGLDVLPYVVVIEAAAQHAYSLPDVGGGAFGYDPPSILSEASESQRTRYIKPSVEEARQWFMAISEASGGSDPARAIQTRAERVDSGWVLNGTKLWASRADVARHGILFARTGKGRSGISAFIIDVPVDGLECRPVQVLRDSPTTELFLDDVRLSEESLLGEPGQGFELAQRWLGKGRLRIGAQALGVAQAAFDMCCDYAIERSTFGKPLASRQMIQERLVDSYVEIRSARALLYECARRASNAGVSVQDSGLVKLTCTEVAFTVIDRVVQIFGGMGLSKEMPIEHWFRSLRVDRIVEGASEVHKMALARSLVGVSVKA